MTFARRHILPLLLLAVAVLSAAVPARSQATATPAAADTLAVDTLAADTLAADTVRVKERFVKRKVDLDNVVQFSAADSIVMIGKQKATIYGDGKITYGNIKLDAAKIAMAIDSSQVHAIGMPDTTGEIAGSPVFHDNSGDYRSKQMSYNFKSKKGFITDIITEQGEGFLTGGITKKMENDEYYIQNGRYTTCDNHDHPHFYFQLTKAKAKPKKNVVFGPAYMVLEDLPLPIAVPFGFFPFTEKYSSGILVPTVGEDYNRGFYLRNGGYYIALSKYFDLALTGEIYTRGSWGIAAQSHYAKRYKFSGSFSINYLTTINGDKGDPDYSKMRNFQVLWSHAQNPKANPNMTFSASVNFATSGYSRNSLDTYYTNAFTENTKSSTVNFTYKFPGTKWSLSTTASINQRTADSTLSVSFPNFTITMSQTAPFKRKRAVGDERWYEKIKISYSGRFQNSLTAKQDEFFHKSLIKDWRNGMMHTMPINATFNLFKYINVTPNITLNDRMYTTKIKRSWDPNASAEIADTTHSFYNIFDFSLGLSLNTKIYGFFRPLKFLGNKLQMIRHVLTPTISFSYTPDFGAPFWGYHGRYTYTDPNGVERQRKYSYFSNGIFGNAPSDKSGIISFTLANNLEAKVRSDADSTGFRKISLIENLTLSQSYNMAADSLRWSNLSTSLLLRITKGFNLNLSATWDVYKYALDANGNPVRINKLRLFNGGGWGRLASTGTSFSYTFNNNTFRRKSSKKAAAATTAAAADGNADPNRENNSDVQLNPDGYAQWDVPWNLSISYSVNYGYGTFNKRKLEYNGKFTHSLSFNGNIRPTKNWNISLSGSYDFEKRKIAYMNCTISRQMHCFEMSASFVPVGPYKSYNFHIAVKSSILQDVKYDKRSSYSNGITWY